MEAIMDAITSAFKGMFDFSFLDSPMNKIKEFFANLGSELRGFFEYLAEFTNFWK